jgi:hypothetical protein
MHYRSKVFTVTESNKTVLDKEPRQLVEQCMKQRFKNHLTSRHYPDDEKRNGSQNVEILA